MREILRSLFGVLLLVTLVPFSATAQQNGDSGRRNLDLQTDSDTYYADPMGRSFQGILPYDPSFDIGQYVLGPGDVLTLTITTSSSEPYIYRSLLVNTSGDITLPRLGAYRVGGTSMDDATELIRQKSEMTFSSPDVHLSLERARPLSVFVNGSVPAPGKKILPAFSRVDLALYAAFNDLNLESALNSSAKSSTLLDQSGYSFRNITIRKMNGGEQYADLVSFFRTGDPDKNPLLSDGDQVLLPRLDPRYSRISISGGVNDPVEMEFRDTDTIPFLVEMASGFSANAATDNALIFRRTKAQTETLEVPSAEWASFKLLPNDRVIIPNAPAAQENASAWVYGEVGLPGNFPIQNGSTNAAEVLEMAGMLTNEALPHAAYLIRAGTSENEIPDQFNTELLKRTSDQLAQGFDYLNLETKLSQDRVYIDLTDRNQLQTVRLFDGDKLYVPRDEQTVFVFGQVNNPGYYSFSGDGSLIRDYISRAGGLALSADPERTFIIKAGSGTWYRPSETPLESGDRIFVDRVPFDELNARRNYELQKQQLKNQRTQLILTGITTITGIVTTYVAIQNLSN